MRQCKLGELCLLATVPRPDICARLARTASRVNSLQGSDVYRINDLVKTVKVWQQAAMLKNWSASHAGKHGKGLEAGKMRQRSTTIHSGTMTLVGWSDAAYADRPTPGKCRLGDAIGLMSTSKRGP